MKAETNKKINIITCFFKSVAISGIDIMGVKKLTIFHQNQKNIWK